MLRKMWQWGSVPALLLGSLLVATNESQAQRFGVGFGRGGYIGSGAGFYGGRGAGWGTGSGWGIGLGLGSGWNNNYWGGRNWGYGGYGGNWWPGRYLSYGVGVGSYPFYGRTYSPYHAGSYYYSAPNYAYSAPFYGGVGSYSTFPSYQGSVVQGSTVYPSGTQSFYYTPGLSGPAAGQGNSVHLRVQVPPDAELWFDGQKTAQTGPVREFVSPPLTPGDTYTYEVRARWTENGQPVDRVKRVQVRAGEFTSIDLLGDRTNEGGADRPAPRLRDDPEPRDLTPRDDLPPRDNLAPRDDLRRDTDRDREDRRPLDSDPTNERPADQDRDSQDNRPIP